MRPNLQKLQVYCSGSVWHNTFYHFGRLYFLTRKSREGKILEVVIIYQNLLYFRYSFTLQKYLACTAYEGISDNVYAAIQTTNNNCIWGGDLNTGSDNWNVMCGGLCKPNFSLAVSGDTYAPFKCTAYDRDICCQYSFSTYKYLIGLARTEVNNMLHFLCFFLYTKFGSFFLGCFLVVEYWGVWFQLLWTL